MHMVGSGLVLIHAGAGYHSVAKEGLYAELCDASCRKGIAVLQSGGGASQAAVEAIKILENSGLTNAGYGSSLTINGDVECDASLMTSDGYFGAVAALKGVKNPITLANKLLHHQYYPPADGRIPPSFLVGEGAVTFAREQGVAIIDPASMVSATSKTAFEKYSRIVEKHAGRKRGHGDGGDNTCSKQSKISTAAAVNDGNGPMDTVGVICMDKEGNLASGLSSGGIALKHSGRVGQAALIGAGCWVEDSIAVATTGCGEQLMRTLLAKTLSQNLLQMPPNDPALTQLDRTMKSSFIDSPALKKDPLKLAGAIVLQVDPSKSCAEMMWSHTTKSMCISHMTTESEKPSTLISRLESDLVSRASTSAGITVRLSQ